MTDETELDATSASTGPQDDGWFDPQSTTFGDRLAGAREASSLSQGELAKRLGVRMQTLRAWENDLSEPRANRVQMLSGLLNVSLVWLLTGEGDGPAPGSATADIVHEVRRLRHDAVRLSERLAVLEGRLRGTES